MDAPEQFDGLLMTIIQKSGGIQNYFDAVYGFLYRKTDFFADEARSKNFVDVGYNVWLNKYKEKAEREEKIKKRREEEEKAKKEAEKKDEGTGGAEVKEITPEEYLRRKKLEDENNLKKEEIMEKQRKEERQREEDEKLKAEGKPVPERKKNEEDDSSKPQKGHVLPNKEKGQTLEKYSWGQMDIKEITINIPVPGNIKGKDLKIECDNKKLYVGIKGQEPIINCELYAPIKSDSMIWTLEEVKVGKMISIAFDKADPTWWESVEKNDNIKVDTQKIQPEATSVSDIEDPELKAQVEKMMFDTRQKAMGKPTSDILQKCPQIEDFMKAHPEMDFSHTKFS